MTRYPIIFLFFFFNDTATTEIYTLSLHDALPISPPSARQNPKIICITTAPTRKATKGVAICPAAKTDRKSTRLNSSHSQISYAVFCLKKKKKIVNMLSSYQSNDQTPLIRSVRMDL